MAKPKIRLDHKGMEAMLKSQPVAKAVHAEAVKVADRVRANAAVVRNGVQDDVEVTDYVTDRAASAVTITHAAGLGLEGKHGVLSRAVGGAA